MTFCCYMTVMPKIHETDGASPSIFYIPRTQSTSNAQTLRISFFVLILLYLLWTKLMTLNVKLLDVLRIYSLEWPSAWFFNDLPPVTYFEVVNLLKSIVPKSSPMDFIPTPLMASCSDVFSHLIAHLANLSFAEWCFPSCFKSTLVTPLLKKNLT